ncbi:MAG: hypothetical protein D6734_12535 [Candidatus Schekmanbacteria bacterium]|nr:MAG: hypothetical protein D6734_12535 [Candidatus Schekmanbacteria bacterium]
MKHSKVVLILFISVFLIILLSPWSIADEKNTQKESYSKIEALDGSYWIQVNEDGFGDENNVAVVAMKEYQNNLYALVRNDKEGAEVWRFDGKHWEQVLFPNNVENGIYNNYFINSHMGAMEVFKGKLYVGFSSGVQGYYLKSSGCEIWRYDGSKWEPVVSDKKDVDEKGIISAISGCKDKDGETTAIFIDSSKKWEKNRWKGGVLQITSGRGRFRRFDIVSNTENTLIVQQNEIGGNRGKEYTVCKEKHYINPFPLHEYDLPPVSAGDSYEIGMGNDENGFGDYFNKAISSMVVFEGKLYASTVLNYDYGGQVWYTIDGENWKITNPPRSLGLFHDDPNYPDSKKPVTRGIPSLGVCDIEGEPNLYAGTLGSDGNLGGCARFAKLTISGWELIVDSSIDENDTGTNENGFGSGMECNMFNGNFNVWSQACFKKKLFVGIQSIAGARVLYTKTASPKDGSWFYSVGGNGKLPAGFDGKTNKGASMVMKKPVFETIAVQLFPYGDYLYAGLVRLYMPLMGAGAETLTGSQIWKTKDGINWVEVTKNGFGDKTILNFQSFCVYKDNLYVSGSRAANTVGGGLGGTKIFKLLK